MKYYGALFIAILQLTGCSSVQTTVLPLTPHEFKIIASGDSYQDAMQGAMDKAREECTHMGLKPYILNDHSEYVGVDKNLMAAINTAELIAFYTSKNYTGPLNSASGDSEYRVEITAKCQ